MLMRTGSRQTLYSPHYQFNSWISPLGVGGSHTIYPPTIHSLIFLMAGMLGEVGFSVPSTICSLTFSPGATYRCLIRQLMLMGFYRHQYSDYRSDNITGMTAWFSAVFLKFINPPMKLETTLLGLKVHHYSNLNILDLTAFMRLGGVLSSRLRGPIPAHLLNPVGPVMGVNGGPPVPPLLVNFQLPRYSRQSFNSVNPHNYVT